MATLFDSPDKDWYRLSRDPVAAGELADVCCLAGAASSLGELEQFVRHADPAGTDRVLLALVTRAVAGSDLAARVLLQLLLPGTRSLARRWWALGDADERAAAAVMAVYHRIRSYPVARRPGRVAANILMDAARELRQAIPRLAHTLTADPSVHGLGAPHGEVEAAPHPSVELAEVLLDAVHDQIIDADDAGLIARSRIAGHRMADIASHRGSRPRTLWDRRQRAEHALVTSWQR